MRTEYTCAKSLKLFYGISPKENTVRSLVLKFECRLVFIECLQVGQTSPVILFSFSHQRVKHLFVYPFHWAFGLRVVRFPIYNLTLARILWSFSPNQHSWTPCHCRSVECVGTMKKNINELTDLFCSCCTLYWISKRLTLSYGPDKLKGSYMSC